MNARLVIAAPSSGAGKTTVVTGLLRALRDRGVRVQAFKVGPDYIDPTCHRLASGRDGCNLDLWLMGEAAVRELFARMTQGAEVAIIEGVMGLYDGAAGGAGSTASLARLLAAPVVLVLDASAGAQSLAATALGFREYDRRLQVAGVIANRVGSDRHAALIAEALQPVGLPLLGALPHDDGLRLPEGRLGLVIGGGVAAWVERAGAAIGQGVDLERLMAIARTAPPLPRAHEGVVFAPDLAGRYAGLTIAIARDEAFWFYYADALAWCQYLGVTLVPFSPVRDPSLPEGCDGLWFGGGFPERHAEALAANIALRRAVQSAYAAGLPMYAECGGFQYLLEEYVVDGRSWPMAGCLKGRTVLMPHLEGLGYRLAEPAQPAQPACHWLAAGEALRGHVFHYGRPQNLEGCSAWRLFRADGSYERLDGRVTPSLLASYLHVHLPTQQRLALAFLERCRRWRDSRKNPENRRDSGRGRSLRGP
ncbi:MAG TPA: cobyrinate a,c-diamide synthase [Bacillota bacterium]